VCGAWRAECRNQANTIGAVWSAPRSAAPRVAGVEAAVGGSVAIRRLVRRVASRPCPGESLAMPIRVPRWRRREIRGRLWSWAQGLAPDAVVVSMWGDYSGATNELKKRTVNCLCNELKKRTVKIRIIWSAPVWRQHLWRLARNDISVIPRLFFFLEKETRVSLEAIFSKIAEGLSDLLRIWSL
jgi:hypothetical protein